MGKKPNIDLSGLPDDVPQDIRDQIRDKIAEVIADGGDVDEVHLIKVGVRHGDESAKSDRKSFADLAGGLAGKSNRRGGLLGVEDDRSDGRSHLPKDKDAVQALADSTVDHVEHLIRKSAGKTGGEVCQVCAVVALANALTTQLQRIAKAGDGAAGFVEATALTAVVSAHLDELGTELTSRGLKALGKEGGFESVLDMLGDLLKSAAKR